MKKKLMKRFLGLSLIFIILSFTGYITSVFSQDATTIVLVNPSLGNIKSFIYFLDNKIIDLDNVELIGIYYKKARRDITRPKKFLEENQYPFIHLKEVDGDLNEKNLFQENSFSKGFYEIFKESDGIVFFGGPDFPPSIYDQKTSLLTNISDPHRHYYELSFLFHLLGGSQDDSFRPYLEEDPGYVVWGFCLGMQTINVAAGGSLYQDIPSDIYGLKYVEDVLKLKKDQLHRNYWRKISIDKEIMGSNLHNIQFTRDFTLPRNLKIDKNDQPLVYSSHHQAVKDLGKGFLVAATSLDGKVIEVIVHQKYKNVVGLQFHPEVTAIYDSNSSRKYKMVPDDIEVYTFFEIMQKENSLRFHHNLWNYFGRCFQKLQ